MAHSLQFSSKFSCVFSINIVDPEATVKPVLSSHLQIGKTKVLMQNGNLMKAKSIAECSLWPALGDNLY